MTDETYNNSVEPTFAPDGAQVFIVAPDLIEPAVAARELADGGKNYAAIVKMLCDEVEASRVRGNKAEGDWLLAVRDAYDETDVSDDELARNLNGTPAENAAGLMRGVSTHDRYLVVHRSLCGYARRMSDEGNSALADCASETAAVLADAYEAAEVSTPNYDLDPITEARAIAAGLPLDDLDGTAWLQRIDVIDDEIRGHWRKVSQGADGPTCAALRDRVAHLTAVRKELAFLYRRPDIVKGLPAPKPIDPQARREEVGAFLKRIVAEAGQVDPNILFSRMMFETNLRASREADWAVTRAGRDADRKSDAAFRRVEALLKTVLPDVFKPVLKRIVDLEHELKTLRGK